MWFEINNNMVKDAAGIALAKYIQCAGSGIAVWNKKDKYYII